MTLVSAEVTHPALLFSAKTIRTSCARKHQAYLWLSLLLVAASSCKREPAPRPPTPAAPEVESCSAWLDFVCKHVEGQDSLCLTVQEGVALLSSEACAKAFEQRAYTEEQLKKRAQQCNLFAQKVCADLPDEKRFCKMTSERVTHYTPDWCIGMLSKYPETLVGLKKQLAADRLTPEKAAPMYQGDPPAFGPKDGPIQIVEFIDFESQFSPKAGVIARSLAAKYPSQLHFVVRQFPLPDNAHAHLAAQAALAAQAQGKYWPMHDKLLENRTQLEAADILRYGKELGLDVAKLKAALDKKTYAAAVDADVAIGKAIQVVGMPTIFVNNERIYNSVDEEGIVAAIEEYLARGAKPTSNGN